MAHDHGEKIHFCIPCGYWHKANGRFQQWKCPKCNSELLYSSREYIITQDKKFETIPKELIFNQEGFA